MRYPFNKYGLKDFIYNNVKAPYNNFKLVKRAGFPYHKWDIMDSIVELTFQQYKDFYETYTDRLIVSKDYYKSDLEDAKKRGAKEEVKSYKNLIKERNEDTKLLQNIYLYITESRKENEVISKKVFDIIYGEVKHTWIDCEEEGLEDCVESVSNGNEYYQYIKYKINDSGLICISKMTPCKREKSNWYNIESERFKLDSKFCKDIIDMRKYLWD